MSHFIYEKKNIKEVKFRAWDKKNNKMRKVGAIDHTGFVTFKPSCRVWHPPSQTDLMRFTGHKSAEGKDIYEGDIVDTGDETDGYTVVWDEDNGQWIISGIVVAENNPLYWETELIIRGNIYENKNLL